MQDLHSAYPGSHQCPGLLPLLDHGFEQAQTSVSQLLHRPIFFHTQGAGLCDWPQVFKNLLDPHSIVVIQSFDGDYQGLVSLDLPKKLWSQVQNREDDLLSNKNRFDFNDDLLNEVSNIMINSLLRSLSVLMVQRFSSGLPQQPSKNTLTHYFSETGFQASRTFVVRTHVCHEKNRVSLSEFQQVQLCFHMRNDALLDHWFASSTSMISLPAI